MAEKGYTLIVGLGATGLSCARHLVARRSCVVVTDSRPAPPALDAIRAEFPELETALGAFDTRLFEYAAEIVLSPGVSPAEPAVRAAVNRGVPVIGDIELFALEAEAPVAAITGSNGKSTVATLVAEMAALDSRRVKIGGNLGPPALSLLEGDAPDLFVLELSSFQLETTRSLHPAAATVLNVSPDHMDRHQDLDHYVEAKRRIFRGDGIMVINLDDPVVASMYEPGRSCIGFSLSAPRGNDFGLVDRNGEVWLGRGSEPLVGLAALPLPGLHNAANCLAALAMGEALGVSMAARLKALANFKGLPHRCQLVAEHDGVRWYDDSKGTNVGATVAAIRGLGAERDLVLIAGGLGKGADFAPLRGPVARHVRHVVLFGRDAGLIEHALAGTVPCTRAEDLKAAVGAAAQAAAPGSAVLFSPACASFDMFENYTARGRAFASAVKARTGR
ncbi:MAG TPA: UDP-N-acetylmuramoyl-L-alanine--D-glutamate ligase [Gammaproteobacteria bacterium]|nr:UDP-N-acetylmuramoyl-L-alanine--D-glutamate ligase [Gammaproteobacteria bacterium]